MSLPIAAIAIDFRLSMSYVLVILPYFNWVLECKL